MDPTAPNPYQPPASLEGLPEQARADSSASRWSRLWAALIDSFLALIIFVPMQYFAGYYRDFPNIKAPAFPGSLLWGLGGVAVWLVLHGVFLARSAQTIGKKALDIQIVNVSDGKPASFERLVLWRFLPTAVLAQVPYVGSVISMIDILLIFRSDRRCGHDHIAKTRVADLLKR